MTEQQQQHNPVVETMDVSDPSSNPTETYRSHLAIKNGIFLGRCGVFIFLYKATELVYGNTTKSQYNARTTGTLTAAQPCGQLPNYTACNNNYCWRIKITRGTCM